MSAAPDPAPLPPKPRRRWLPRLRFSLRTLVILVLLTCSAGGLWWRWDSWVFQPFSVEQTAGLELFAEPAFSPDSTLLAMGCTDQKIHISDLGSGKDKFVLDFGVKAFAYPMVFSQDMHYFAAGFYRGAWSFLRIWDLKSGGIVYEVEGDPEHEVFPAKFADMQFLNAKHQNLRQIHINNVETQALALSTDRTRAVIVAPNKVIVDCNTGDVLFKLEPKNRYTGFTNFDIFSPNGDFLVSICEGDQTKLFHRRRPERWWGVAWLPEFWLTALFAGALVWSVWRDRRQVCRDSDLSADLR